MNILFLTQVLPYPLDASPKVRAYFVLRHLAQHHAVTLATFVRGSQAFVVPLRAGGGMRVKILDAWAQGVPIVSTTIGAEGLTYRAGEDILIADTPEAFAQSVLAVLQDAGLARRLAAAGRATVEQRYDWRRVYPTWDEVYAGG